MAAESARKFEALEAQAATLLEMFRTGGYEQVAPSIIQPADVLLDQIGEAIRGRTYVFTDLSGEELCLRPDLTVPVSRLYLERHPRADAPARYCYNGPAFRFQPKGASGTHPREFRQAGIECFGVADRDSADAEVVLLVADAVKSAGLKQFNFRFGDIALFYALLDALSLPDHAADLRSEPLPREVATVLDYYLAVEASPREAIDRLAMIGQGAGIDLG